MLQHRYLVTRDPPIEISCKNILSSVQCPALTCNLAGLGPVSPWRIVTLDTFWDEEGAVTINYRELDTEESG